VASPSLFELLPDVEKAELLTTTRRRRFRRADTIFHEGDPGDTLHVITKGIVAIKVTTPLGDVVTLTVLGPEESFGEHAAIGDGAPRSASAVAVTEVETLCINRAALDELRRHRPRVEQLIVAMLAEQVRRTTEHLLEALYVPADKRILRRLLHLQGIGGGDEGTALPFTQDDIASMAGTSRPTVNRALTRLRDDGLIELGRGRVTVLDRAAIERKAR
jgi:CRP/FNR family transcriptional regulator, cyclic AMP receptor protein